MNRTFPISFAVVLASSSLVAACQDTPAPKGEVPGATAAVNGVELKGLRALAVQDPGGDAKIDQRIRELQAMVAKSPRKLDAWILLGRAWVQKARQAPDPGFYANANACADVALELKPDNALALDLRGMVLMNEHRFDDARRLMMTVLERDPDDLMALGTLSDAWLELGETEKAIETAQRMVDLKPNLPSYARASYLRFVVGDTDGAIEIIRHAIDSGRGSRDPEPLAWVLVEAAKLFWHKGDLEGAAAGFEHALVALPEYPPALVGRAKVELAKGNASYATQLAKKAYGMSALAETARVWHDAAEAAGLADEQKVAREKLVRLGEHGEGRVLAAFYADRNEQLEDALRLVDRELITRSDLHSHDARAWTLYRLGRLDEAKQAILRARRHGTVEAQLLLHEGAIRMATGEKEAGRALVEQALALKSGLTPQAAREARALIDADG